MQPSRTPRTARRRRLGRLLTGVATIGLALGLASFGGFAGTAHADTVVVSTSPANGEQVVSAPAQITVVFNQTVPANSVLQAVCDQQPAPLGPVQVGADGISLSVAVTGAIPVGICNVTYSVPQADGKVATGSFSFEVLDPTKVDPGDVTELDPTDGGNLTSDPPPVSGPLGLARLISYIALSALLGAVAFLVLYWPEGIEDMHVMRFLRLSWILAMVSTFFVAVLTTALVTGNSFTSSILPTSWFEMIDSGSGAAIVLRFVLVAASIRVINRPELLLEPQTQAIALAGPALAVLSLAFTRSGQEFSVPGTLAGLFHVTSVALWFGGLLMLAQAVLVAPGDEDIVQALRGFTKHAPLFITIAVVSGMIQLYVLDGGAILTSRHGRLIVLKSIGVAAMVYLGMLTRQIVAARLARARTVNARFAASLRRAVAAEAGFGVFVLALASWAVATLPKNIEPPGTDRTNYAFIGDRSGGAFDVQVKITPAKVGLNAVRLDLYSPDSGVTDLQVQFNPPTNNTASVTLMVPLDGKGAARLPMKEGIPFGIPGLWTVIVSGNGPGGPLPSVTYTVSVMSNDGEDLVVSTTQPATGVTVNSAVTVPMTALVPVGGSTTTPTGVAPVQQGIQPVTAATPSTQG
jgi:copper transport protein